ncbi:methyl-accepting chemotaxis protein [Oricola cellulosilytica]|uniref:Methyl-accepting chemotaxis protein n=1 Tax=Oricola cellulosilytica TaxID=1429082 RepID=A0A4R0P544_9HYPH|nr:methyl-accepting chemotaxis protein [Oricola cellulosilytica]TCD10963.1 methyl-accepting chemotaxis protein [Oricola cellulosilytica]
MRIFRGLLEASIRAKLIAIGVVTAAGFIGLVAIGWVSGSTSVEAVQGGRAMNVEIRNIEEMRIAGLEMVLAAMDTIIDRDEGVMLPERAETVAAALKTIREGTRSASHIANMVNRPELMETFSADLEEVAEAIQVQLPELIKNNASQAEFAAIDDAIDGGGERILDNLQRLAELGIEHVRMKLGSAETAAENSKIYQSTAAIVFLVLVCGMMALVTRGIIRSLAGLRDDMKAVADGDLSREIKGAERSDEIGLMAQSVLVLQQAAVDKERMEREAEENRDLTDKERAEREAAKAAEAATLNEAIEALAGGLQQLSAGDLTARIDKPFTESLDRLRVDFNESVEKLSETLSEVKVNIDTIHSNAGEMRSAVEQLSSRTEQQAASLEETSASLEEITATVNSSSERADEATRKAAEAKSASDSSARVVSDAVEAMGRIENASGEIAKIIGVIDEIAFQTNLLALNAGVEAARAGEAGKGFAVVAQEVRELAQRSATAAKEIKALIDKSTDEVEGGVGLVKATGEALTKIAEQVTDINDHIASIAKAAREQATGLAEINSAVGQMDKVTQQNAAMVEETTAVTHRLAGDADSLTALVGRFAVPSSGGLRSERSAPALAVVGENDGERAPSKSPAKSVMNKVKQAFGGNAAVKQDNWEDF